MKNTVRNKREIEKEKKTIEGISIHTNQAEKNILTTGDHIKYSKGKRGRERGRKTGKERENKNFFHFRHKRNRTYVN